MNSSCPRTATSNERALRSGNEPFVVYDNGMRGVLIVLTCASQLAYADPKRPGRIETKVSVGDASKLLYLDAEPPTSCAKDAAPIACLITARYSRDTKAADVALALFRDQGHVAGLGAEEIMDGGYRGKIRLVPELPIGTYRKHLTWVASAMTQIDTFFTAFDRAPNYRWRALALRFVRSVGKRTPSA